MELFEILQREKVKTLSIVGTAKNVGKTVTLNYFVNRAVLKGVPLGLTSLGRDGEPLDLITGKKKPPVYAPAGTLILTAEKSLQNSSVELEKILKTGIETSLGEIVMGRVKKAGMVELAGPALLRDLRIFVNKMLAEGAELVLIDGALDRLSVAGEVSQATVLATGAALGDNLQEIIPPSREKIEQLSLPLPPSKSVLEEARLYIDKRKSALLSSDGSLIQGLKKMQISQPGYLSELAKKYPNAVFVLAGAVIGKTVQELAMTRTGVSIIIKNATSLFLDEGQWPAVKRNIDIWVVYPLKILAVTVNPTSPLGRDYSAVKFLEQMKAELGPLPVYDVVLNFYEGKEQFA